VTNTVREQALLRDRIARARLEAGDVPAMRPSVGVARSLPKRLKTDRWRKAGIVWI